MELRYTPTSVPGLSAAKVRDLNYFRFGNNRIAVACDSSGSIGELEGDAFHATSAEAGVNMVEVPLKEILSVGARPLAVYLDFCYAKNFFTDGFIASVHEELRAVGTDVPVFVTFGTEPNPRYSALGLAILAEAHEDALRVGTAMPGDLVYVIGLPLNKDYYPLQLRTQTLSQLLALDYVHEVLPCGSHGILYEARELAETNGLGFVECGNALLDSQNQRSCGAAAVALVCIPPEKQAEFEAIPLPRERNLYGTLTGSKPAAASRSASVPESGCRVDADGNLHFSDGYCIRHAAARSYGLGEQSEDRPAPGGLEALALRLADEALSPLEAQQAAPFLLINDLNFAMEPLGRRTIRAISGMLAERYPGVNLPAQFTGSTEDNFPTHQSGFALHAFGLQTP